MGGAPLNQYNSKGETPLTLNSKKHGTQPSSPRSYEEISSLKKYH